MARVLALCDSGFTLDMVIFDYLFDFSKKQMLILIRAPQCFIVHVNDWHLKVGCLLEVLF